MAVVYRWGETKDMPRIVEAINHAFRPNEMTEDAEKNIGPESYFPRVLPKLYLEKDSASCHYLTEEGGAIAGIVGLFPVPLTVGEKTLKLSGIGMVSTRPGYRRKGYMVRMMEDVIAEARRRGDDLLVLGGQRQRYRNFGFDNAGADPSFYITEGNIRRTYDKTPEGYSFHEVKESDEAYLHFMQELRKKDLSHSSIWDGNEYEASLTLVHRPFVILKDGECAGSFLLGRPSEESMELPSMEDLRLLDGDKAADVIAAYLASTGMPGVCVSNTAPEALLLRASLSRLCDFTAITTGEMIRVLNYRNTLDAYLNYQARIRPLADGEACFAFDSGEKLCVRVQGGVPSVTEAPENADCISFTADEAVRVLFSNEAYFTDEGKGLSAAAGSWFPLPFYLAKSDEV